MGSFAALFAALTIAFPRPSQQLPAIDTVYVIGAVPRGVTNVTVNGAAVEISRTGAWATVIPLTTGETNAVRVTWAGKESGETNFTVKVAAKPKPILSQGVGPQKPPKKWEKLPYASDTPEPSPFGKAPPEVTLILDPGHGGDDTGALSPHGFYEKQANLLTAREVKKALEAFGYRVLMTRETDVFIPLYDRPKLAHKEKAAAFISIHHNAPPLDKDPRRLRYAAVYAWNDIGRSLAQDISSAFDEALEGEMPNNGVLMGNLAVTRNPEIPSCLVEVDFVTSPEGEAAIWNVTRRRYMAQAIANGIHAWCNKPPAKE